MTVVFGFVVRSVCVGERLWCWWWSWGVGFWVWSGGECIGKVVMMMELGYGNFGCEYNVCYVRLVEKGREGGTERGMC